MHMKSLGLLLFLGAAVGSASAEAAVTCSIAEKSQCQAGTGCSAVQPTIVIRLDMATNSYSRCDAKGCDDFVAQYSQSGNYINIALPERGMMAKLSMDGSSFTEVATLAGVVLVSFGSCK